MHAIKLKKHVGEDRRIAIDLPAGFPEGEVEVIVLAPAGAEDSSEALRTFFAELDRAPGRRLSREEVDDYLAKERASWE
jgi:hypothetical protein